MSQSGPRRIIHYFVIVNFYLSVAKKWWPHEICWCIQIKKQMSKQDQVTNELYYLVVVIYYLGAEARLMVLINKQISISCMYSMGGAEQTTTLVAQLTSEISQLSVTKQNPTLILYSVYQRLQFCRSHFACSSFSVAF